VKILALYDIHGNVDALDAVLADPRAAGADLVVVGGDAVPGPFCHEVLDRLQALRPPVVWVRGNGEREVAAAAAAAAEPGDPPTAAGSGVGEAADRTDVAAITAHRTARRLGAHRARALGGLPLTIERDGVLLCHATPRRDDELLTRLSPVRRFEQALQGVTARLVVAGHTHQQDDRAVGDMTFVNAGSVGLPYEGDGAARWLWVDDGEPRLLSTTYDCATAGRRMLEAGWPDEESITASLIDPIDPAEVTGLFEQAAS